LTRTEDVNRSGVPFQSGYIASPNTPIEIRLILPVQVSASVRPNSYAEALSCQSFHRSASVLWGI
jgi:hypothetical protein